MNEELLYKLRPPIHEEFAEAFKQKVTRTTSTHSRWHDFHGLISQPRVWLPTLLGLVILAACIQQLLSPDFHKADEIAGTTIYETTYRLVPSKSIEWFQETMSQQPLSVPSDQGAHPGLTKDEALSAILFSPALPKYLPEGYHVYKASFNDYMGNDALSIYYLDMTDSSNYIWLTARQTSDDASHEIIVAPGKWDALEINGVQAIFERGNWGDWASAATPTPGEDYVRVFWDDNRGYSLYWTKENIRYELHTYVADIAEDDFIRIAKSMIQ
jgi:hypothetical protein